MGYRLRVSSGPLQGKEFVISAGDVIGRAAVEIQVNDPKISGRHAKFEFTKPNTWKLIDLGSRSGIRQGDQKLTSLILSINTQFTLGRTDFTVIEDLSSTDATTLPPIPIKGSRTDSPAIADAAKDKQPTTPINTVSKRSAAPTPALPVSWNEYLAHFCMRAREKIANSPVELLPFNPLLVLKVLTGAQAGTEWVLGYGPRDVGLGSIDLPLFEEESPPVAFTVRPEGTSVVFTTAVPEKVKLNNRATSSETLVSGDEIDVGNTKIKVSFKE